jgi:hypothetical protein
VDENQIALKNILSANHQDEINKQAESKVKAQVGIKLNFKGWRLDPKANTNHSLIPGLWSS